MARPSLLSESELAAWLQDNPSWSPNGLFLERTIVFGDFSEAFGFMARAAILAEKLDHHPDWSNVYSKVKIALTTHDAGGLTGLDTTFAEGVDKILGAYKAS